jgi:alpha-galactosidase
VKKIHVTVQIVTALACVFPALLILSARAAASPRGAVAFVEAEDGVFTGIVDEHCCWRNVLLVDVPQSTHSGRGFVDTKNERGSHAEVAFDVRTAGHHRLWVRYTHNKPDDRAAELRVNGEVVTPSLEFPPTGGWSAWRTVSLPVKLQAGRNVVRLTALHGEGLANLDHFMIREIRPAGTPGVPEAQIVEAESGVFSGHVERHCCFKSIALEEGDHSTYSGRGFVDVVNEIGSHIEVLFDAPAAGRYTLGVRYLHQKSDDRTAEVRVNGKVADPALAFPRVGLWTVWRTTTTTVELQAGRNVIRLVALKPDGLCNIDRFELAKH